MINGKIQYLNGRRPKKVIIRKRFYIFITLIMLVVVSLIKCSTGSSELKDPGIVFAESNVVKEVEKRFTVCLDPGHGGYDVGTENKELGVYEKDIVLDITLKIGEILEENDVGVVYTRKTDSISWSNQKESLKGRSEISNKANVDYFISIHTNSYKGSSYVKGTEVWCRFKDTEDETLAQTISDELSKVGFTENRGIKYEDEKKLYVLENTDAVSTLVELGYLSNNQDTKFLMSEEGRKQCAEAIANAILDYYNSTTVEIVE